MTRDVKFSHLEDVLDEVDYPVTRDAATDAFEDVTLLLADGEANLGELIAETASTRFDSIEDLVSELHNTLPREAVGEPYQSEGDA